MIVAVAVLAVLITAYRFLGGSLYRRREALMFAVAESDATAEAARLERAGRSGLAGRSRRRAAYFAAQRRKYEQAARRPWLTVAPDPPPLD